MINIEKLKEVIVKVMPDVKADGVTEETKLVEDLQFDSLGIMMLAMALEDEFGVRFDGPVQFNTVGDVIKYLEENAK
ncbi:MAG: acyl carrier protein [Bacilli bacterium]|nr:acyl carrier protein [Bacilli bacterium]